jgi:uncharacterized protein (TIGR02453 family)
MAWFDDDFNRFFKDLAKQNNQDWFDANRKRYVKSVKDPFASFVLELIRRVHAEDKRVQLEPKDAIFRINRDIRFSKDKTPYKLSCSAIISPGGRKDHSTPGLYFELGPEHVAIYGGRYMPEAEDLRMIRAHISANLRKFKVLCEAPAFKAKFGGIQGERNKVLPAEWKAAAEKEPLLFNKQFYWMAELPAKLVTDPKLADILMDHYRTMRPLNDFLLGPKG